MRLAFCIWWDYRLGQPGGSGVALVEHDGYGLCIAGARRSAGAHGTPKIFNTDQGAQFTSAASPAGSRLRASRFDGRTRSFHGQYFLERLWRSIKYEEVHLKAYC